MTKKQEEPKVVYNPLDRVLCWSLLVMGAILAGMGFVNDSDRWILLGSLMIMYVGLSD